jgi:hypothetical protein
VATDLQRYDATPYEMFLLGLGVAVIGNVLFQVVGGFLLSAVAVLGDVMVLMSVGQWMYERVRHRGQSYPFE